MDDRELSPWLLIGASAQGRSHKLAAVRCQDAFNYKICGDFAIAAISDGAGSAELAHLGSSIAVDAVISTLTASAKAGTPTLDDLRQGFVASRDAVERDAVERDRSSFDYACTLLVLIVGPELTLVGQIGDGAIVGVPYSGGGVQVLSWPQQGEYANATVFLVQRDIEPFLSEASPLSAFALFSDGLQNVALEYASRSAYSPFFAPFFGALRARDTRPNELEQHLVTYLNDDPELASRTDDDLSLVVGIRI